MPLLSDLANAIEKVLVLWINEYSNTRSLMVWCGGRGMLVFVKCYEGESRQVEMYLLTYFGGRGFGGGGANINLKSMLVCSHSSW